MRWPICSSVCNCPSTSVRIVAGICSSIAARCSASAFSPALRPPRSTTPNSYSSPRSEFTVAVRTLTQCERVRCSDSTACCSTLFCGTRRMSLCCAAHPDRPRVGRIVLVAAHERSHLRQPAAAPPGGPARRARVPSGARCRTLPSRCAPAAAARSTPPAWPAPASCDQSRPSRHQPSAVASRSLQCPNRKSYDPFGASVSEVHSGTSLWHSMPCDARPHPVASPLLLAKRYSSGLSHITASVHRVGGVHAISCCRPVGSRPEFDAEA